MAIIIFNHRRDLRISDNIALYKSLTFGKDVIVIPTFFFDPHQIVRHNGNKNYFSEKSAYFVIQSVMDLKEEYRKIGSDLLILYDEPKKCLETIVKILQKKYNDKLILSYNMDYSKYSVKRDASLNKIASDNNMDVINDDEMSDYCLMPWTSMLRDPSNLIAYKQYGAYYKNAIKTNVHEPLNYKQHYNKLINKRLYNKLFKKTEFTDISSLMEPSLINSDSTEQWNTAGRSNCLKRLNITNMNHLKTYNIDRDTLSYNTSNISAYLNIGAVSVREIYKLFLKALGKATELIKQLFWRDFYLCALRYLPNGNEYHHMDARYDNLKWSCYQPKTSNKYKLMEEYWNKMMDSKTGFLLVDAGMMQLKETGFLHGRLRMIVGTFWTKYLLIDIFDPKYGSQVGYSRLLVDAIGPSQNKMNHQWITEFDAPGHRYSAPNAPLSGRPMNIANIQIKKFDKECIFIKKWLPHLANVPNKDLYNWSENIANKYNNTNSSGLNTHPLNGGTLHPAPMFDAKEKYKEWIRLCTL